MLFLDIKNCDFAYKINNGNNVNILIYDKENSQNLLNIPVNKGNDIFRMDLAFILGYLS